MEYIKINYKMPGLSNKNLLSMIVIVLGLIPQQDLAQTLVDSTRIGASSVVDLWPAGRMPGKGADLPESSTNLGTLRITNVSCPTIGIYPAKTWPGSRPAMLICPGGAYSRIAYIKEGERIAFWLNSLGITGVVLKYRVPKNRDGAIQDLQRAIRLVKANASTWKIDKKSIGLIGFSAGGHLVARLISQTPQTNYDAIDQIDSYSTHVDLAMFVYPAYLSKADSLDIAFKPKSTFPPIFIAHTRDDSLFVKGSLAFKSELDRSGISSTFFLVDTGGHGYGLESDKEIKIWPQVAAKWLKEHHFIY